MKRSVYLLQGTLCGILAASFYGMIPLFTVPLYRHGLNPQTVLTARYLLSALILGFMLLCRRKRFVTSGVPLIQIILYGLMLALSTLLLFFSYACMDTGLAATVFFVYPAVVAAIMVFGYRERLTPSLLTGMTLAILGVCLLSHGDRGAIVTPEGIALAIGSAAVSGTYLVMLQKSALRKMGGELTTFYGVLFGSPLFLVSALLGPGLQAITNPNDWALILALALVSTVASFVLMNVSIRRIGATRTAVIGALEPITAILTGTLLFGETLTAQSMTGIGLIILSVILVNLAPRRTHAP